MVRELQKSDLAEAAAMLAALHAVHWENVPGIFGDLPAGHFEKEAARILKDRRQLKLVYQKGAQLQGICVASVRPVNNPAIGRIGEVHSLYVCPACRRQGVATALLQAMLTAIRQKGVSHVQLKVWAFNEPAAAFYKKVGFQSLFETMDYVLR